MLEGVEPIHADPLRVELKTIHELTAMSYADKHRKVFNVLMRNNLADNKVVWDTVLSNLESNRTPPTSEYEEELDLKVYS